jgi:CO/xanthine dehydrogenase FAD-binding subunit
MRSFLPQFEVVTPSSVEEALALLARGEGWRPLAGGTDIMVLLEAGKLVERRHVNLWGLAALRRIEVSPRRIALGALTTYTDVRRHPVLQAEFPLLCRAAAETGGLATQNRGTLAGNIANASPAADSPPALLCYDAELELLSARGARRVAYHGFHTGYKQVQMAADEIISRILLPRRKSASPAARGSPHFASYYRKVGTRRAQAISKVCMAGRLELGDGRITDVRIALGSVAPVPLRCVKTEALLRGQPPGPALLRAAQRELAGEIAPIDDMRSTARYRLRVAQNLLAEFLGATLPR